MKLLGALVCATALLCVSASPLMNDDSYTELQSRAAGCTFHPNCDSTGEEKIPIPCDGYCDRYFFCSNGNPVLKQCPSFLGFRQNFNNYNRQCETSFKNCDWWRDGQPTTQDPTGSTATQDPNKPTTTDRPTDNPGTASTSPTTEGPCHQNADCDATGTQKKPIPCAGFCNRYYLCVEGLPTVTTCPTFQNFNNVTRECSVSFNNCNWYKEFENSSPATDRPTSSPTTSSSPKPTTSKPGQNTTKKPNGASSLVNSTTSLLLAVLIPVLARHL